MTEHEFISELVERIRALDFLEMMGKYMRLVRTSSVTYLGICPFHDDERLGSFVVTPGTERFNCFACDKGGNGIIAFVRMKENLGFVQAVYELSLDNGLVSAREFEEYFVRKNFNHKRAKVERTFLPPKTQPKNHIGDDKLLNAVFHTFLDCLTLRSKHREHLNTQRQINDETIAARKYRSVQTATDLFMKTFERALTENVELSERMQELKLERPIDVLEFIPGFYQKEVNSEWQWTFNGSQGIFIPIQNPEGQIVGLQIRKDKADEGISRYAWFSSSFASYTDHCRKGTSAGSPVDVLYPNHFPSKALFITEGRFKSEAINSRIGAVSVSVQGVTNWKDINASIVKIEAVAKEKYNGFQSFENICIAFDNDMTYKFQVYQQLQRLSDSLAEAFPDKKIYYVHWEGDCKGLDDLLLSHPTQSKRELSKLFNTHRKEYFDVEYDKQVRFALEACGQEHISNLSQTALRQIRVVPEKK